MFDDAQRRRDEFELLTGLLAELDARLAAARTELLGFGERMFLATARQIFGQWLATVRLLLFLPRRLGDRRLVDFSRRRFRRRRTRIEERGPIAGHALGTRTVDSPKQLFESMLQACVFPITFREDRQQFAEHALTGRQIVGNGNVKRHGFLHHAS